MSFSYAVECGEADRVALMLALIEAAGRCRELGPPYAAVLGGWAGNLAAGAVMLRVAGLDKLERETLHAVVRLAAGRHEELAPLGALLRAVERFAYGPAGYRQPLPTGREPGWSTELVRML